MEDTDPFSDNALDPWPQDAEVEALKKRVADMEQYIQDFTVIGDGISGSGGDWTYNPPETTE